MVPLKPLFSVNLQLSSIHPLLYPVDQFTNFSRFVTLSAVLSITPSTMALKRKRPIHRQEDISNKRHKVTVSVFHTDFQFQSFSERIERLNIDVLRKVRPVIPDATADDDDTYVPLRFAMSDSQVFSFFSESMKKWKDLNLSATFTEFYRNVLPISESLPQVIHHQEKIMSLLEEYISRQDPLASHSLLEYSQTWNYSADGQHARTTRP